MSAGRTRVLVLVYSPQHLCAIHARGMPVREAQYLADSKPHYSYMVDIGTVTGQRIADGLVRLERSVTRTRFDNPQGAASQRGLSRQKWLVSLLEQVDRVHVLELDPDPPKWVDRLRQEAHLRSIKFRSIWLWHQAA